MTTEHVISFYNGDINDPQDVIVMAYDIKPSEGAARILQGYTRIVTEAQSGAIIAAYTGSRWRIMTGQYAGMVRDWFAFHDVRPPLPSPQEHSETSGPPPLTDNQVVTELLNEWAAHPDDWNGGDAVDFIGGLLQRAGLIHRDGTVIVRER